MKTQNNDLTMPFNVLDGKVQRKAPVKPRTNKGNPSAIAAATRLRESKVIINTKPSGDEIGMTSRSDFYGSLPLRCSIPLSMSLVKQLIRMPLIVGPIKGSSNSRGDYVLSCDKDLCIWHQSADAHGVLRDFPLQTASCRGEFAYFVLWALSAKLPGVYAQLINESFGPSKDSVSKTIEELPAPIPYDHLEPPFQFNYGKVFGFDSIHPTALVHTFISGATGVGKTYGGVKPLLQSFLTYKSTQGKQMGMLVIDPKSELLQVCATELANTSQPERLVRLGSREKLSFFKNKSDLGLEERYRALANLVQIRTAGEGALWQEKGNRLNLNMAGSDRLFQLQTGTLLWGVVRSLLEGEDFTQESQWANILAVYRHATYSKASLDWIACVSPILLQLCPGLDGQKSPFVVYTSDGEMLNQLYYRVSNAEKVCADLSSAEVTNVISTDLYPSSCRHDSCVEDLLDQGKVLLLQPKSSYFGDIVGRLVKSRFFADALTRQDMMRPIGYVADEFQRFITSDRDTGEQNFLDRCRAYRVNCVLATQSLSSIEHALTQSGESSPRLSVDIIVANSPTKVIYRSTDLTTQKSLREWIPPAPSGRSHVVDVRPVAQLPTGSAYFMFNGDWGMYRYDKQDRRTSRSPEVTAVNSTRIKNRNKS